MTASPVPTRTDDFLGGRLRLTQPAHGYRAGADAVMLAAACAAAPGQSVLELGCGAGAALLCLGVRVPGLTLAGIERDLLAANLARANADAAGLAAQIVIGDLSQLPPGVAASWRKGRSVATCARRARCWRRRTTSRTAIRIAGGRRRR